MAFISVDDLYGSIECVAFPAVFEKIREAVVPDKIVRLAGKLQLDEEKAPVIILDKMSEYVERESAQAAAPEQVKKREHALWLNASLLTEEEFDEFIGLFTHYMNGNTVVKIKRGGKLFKMAGVHYCHGLHDELRLYLNDGEIVMV